MIFTTTRELLFDYVSTTLPLCGERPPSYAVDLVDVGVSTVLSVGVQARSLYGVGLTMSRRSARVHIPKGSFSSRSKLKYVRFLARPQSFVYGSQQWGLAYSPRRGVRLHVPLIHIGWREGNSSGGFRCFDDYDRTPFPLLVFPYFYLPDLSDFNIPSGSFATPTVLSREAVAKMSPSADQAQSQIILVWDLSAATRV